MSLAELPTSDDISALQKAYQSLDGRIAIAVGTDGTIIASQDGGDNWLKRDSSVGQNLRDVALYPDNRRGIAVGAAGTILRTDDGGLSWSEISTDHENTLFTVALHPDGERGLAAGELGTLMETRDGGRNWTTRRLETLHTYLTLRNADPQPTPFAGDIIDIQLSSDGQRGVALASAVLFSFQYEEETWVHPLPGTIIEAVAFRSDALSGIAVDGIGSILATTDAGGHWTEVAKSSLLGMTDIAVSNDGTRAIAVRGGPQSLDRLAAKLRVNLLSIICCQIDRSSSSSSQNNNFLVLWSSWARGAKVWSGGGQRRGVAQGLSTRPAGFAPVRRTRPQIHGTGRSTRTERPATGPISAAIPASTSQAARSSHWTPACTSAGVRPPNAECGRSPL